MRQSKLFTKTRKEAPKDETSKNAELLIRAGFVHKEMAGVYAYLPLGLRVLEKIKTIVRQEMNMIGGQELIMTTLQRKELWEQTKRWSDDVVDVWFKSELKAGGEVGFGWSHEEPIGEMMKGYISSFRDLPIFVYQFQTKLRNELRAKSGVMRGREFVMKDMYSFCLDSTQHEAFYEATIKAYMNVYRRLGLGADTFVTFASGGAFTKFSHEFQTIVSSGEDVIYVNREKNIAINGEVLNDDTLQSLGITRSELTETKTAEVGNIFNFGTQKSEDLGLYYMSESGEKIPVWMGSYGIGVTRLVGVLVEKFADDKGMVWPEEASPFSLHLIRVGEEEAVKKASDQLYESLCRAGIEVLYDDRDLRAGEKFADSDLIGIPLRAVVSQKTIDANVIEVKERKGGTAVSMKEPELIARLADHQ